MPRSRSGIMDSDETIRSLALTAALEDCPRSIVPTIKRIVDDASGSSAIRTLAIRVFARSGISGAVESLASLALVRKFRFLPRRVAAKSPEVLAAIAGLAAHWSSEPRAAEVLQRARRHRDPEIRAAAGIEPVSDPVRFLTALSQTLSSVALYGDDHPATARAQEKAHQRLLELQSAAPA